MEIRRVVGLNIRAVRKAKGWTQFQLAERSGLSADFIGKVERGTTSASIESLQHIAAALQVSLPELFAGAAEAGAPNEALIELIRMCKEHPREDIELLLGIARLIFHRLQDPSQSS